MKKRILICAFACDPNTGSEGAVGWEWSLAAAKNHDVTVITTADAKEAIEDYRKRHQCGDEFTFHYIPRSAFFKFSLKIFHIFPILFWWNYIHRWQSAAYEAGKKLHSETPFDLVHNVTYVGFRAPGFWYEMSIPFVWGPIGGLEQTNLKLAWALGVRCFVWYWFRNILNWRDKIFCRRAKLGMKKASGSILSATSNIQAEIKKYYGQDSEIISEIVMRRKKMDDFVPETREENAPLRLIWIGRMIPGKGFPFLLKALERLSGSVKWRLDVFGDGICREKWEASAKKAGISDRILWHGECPREEVICRLRRSHVLVISSIYELTCTVAVEALAAGVPAIAPDICGFHDSVPDGCGIRFPAADAECFVTGLHHAVETMYADEAMRRRMAVNAYAAAEKFHSDSLAAALEHVYRRAVS